MKSTIELTRTCHRTALVKDPDYRALDQGKGVKGVWVPSTPHLVVGEVKKWAEEAGVESINIPAYWLDKKGFNLPIDARPSEGEKVLYVLHGGAYAIQSAHPDSLAAVIPRGILKHTSGSVRRAFMLEYRNSKSPTSSTAGNPFPAALLDAIAGYSYLVNAVGFAPENIIVEGDSAGGNLGLALIRYLIDNKGVDGIPATPGALILLSPWTDLHPDTSNLKSSFITNAKTDYVSKLASPSGSAVRNFLGPHGMVAASTNPYISPASLAQSMPPVSFDGYPRTLIISGAAEFLVDQIRCLYDKMNASIGPNVQYAEFPDIWHDHIAFSNLGPQRSMALKLIGEWIGE